MVDQFGPRPEKGKYVELGYAIGTGKKIFLCGFDTSCVFYALPQCIRVRTLNDIPLQ
jgi:hypothetical protein